MKRLCFVTTAGFIVNFFLLGLLRALRGRYQLTVAANTDEPRFLAEQGIDARVFPFGIERGIAPFADLRALGELGAFLRANPQDALVSLAPKAGLLAGIAGRRAGVPVRCHVFQGEVWAARRGPMRALLKATDRLTVRNATHLLVISESERAFLERERVVEPGRLRLIRNGSIVGVDLERFRADAGWRREARAELGVPQEAELILFLGRLTHDKGVLDLAHAFRALAARRPNAWLACVGPDEQGLRPGIEAAAGERVRFAGMTAQPERFVAAADVLALPSYREGFGNVIIEAAAAGVPAVASRIYGIEDALLDGETGLLHAPRDPDAIAGSLEKLLADPALRQRLGERARERVRASFAATDSIAFWQDYLEAALR